jgi:hypothetical protein
MAGGAKNTQKTNPAKAHRFVEVVKMGYSPKNPVRSWLFDPTNAWSK